ncbi:MAG: aminomethyl-transferring glycine dehydrogenase subunit GcvPA [Deltaproteobacteria bacterium]|nr:aminomethyl-transferring glycine dehydrogenase subunit GcvPA [Deltaproteobacteria bacterium]
MKYLPHSDKEIREMLAVLGISSIDALFDSIPEKFKLKNLLNIPSGLSERELDNLLKSISDSNIAKDFTIFLGGGIYNHYIPKVIDNLLLRQEFYTAYTPYQPEISQGTLQAIYEFQTMVASILGLDVANASMYDGSTAAAEAVLMARRLSKSPKKFALSSAVHPEYRSVIKTYLKHLGDEIVELPFDNLSGKTIFDEKLVEGSYCVVVQYPNFFGVIEDLDCFSSKAKEMRVPLISVTTEPLSLLLIKSPGSLGVDIAVAEGQSFGVPMCVGGPTVGWFAAKKELVRNMPGRLVGETTDGNGERVFVLTLSTREQHIRREKATSNICTNSGLNALANAIYMAYNGVEGLKRLSVENHLKAEFLKNRLKEKGIKVRFSSDTFNEFVVELDDVEGFYNNALSKKVIPGIMLKKFYSELEDSILITVTEQNTEEQIEMLVSAVT